MTPTVTSRTDATWPSVYLPPSMRERTRVVRHALGARARSGASRWDAPATQNEGADRHVDEQDRALEHHVEGHRDVEVVDGRGQDRGQPRHEHASCVHECNRGHEHTWGGQTHCTRSPQRTEMVHNRDPPRLEAQVAEPRRRAGFRDRIDTAVRTVSGRACTWPMGR